MSDQPRKSTKPGYSESRLKGLKAPYGALEGEARSEQFRVRTQTMTQFEWWKSLTSVQRGELIAWAMEQGWTPTPKKSAPPVIVESPEPEIEEEEEEEDD
ncbi:hypothetical protein QOL99_11885 [Deinococcus sp. MIMF12]|uniref:Uncharacterized protein n=1 Tax=Deinococcus rhizophilus TaxID=3049544 RepID=A0ABT7JIF9_9DEIO|nr:hypothetical protein [Deinococcus rhizophilus]MDL2344847.1 hypothetical protein [Deinococcus rhizophilus]